MTRDELLAELRELANEDDAESAHWGADQALIAYIADEEIRAAYKAIGKWYS